MARLVRHTQVGPYKIEPGQLPADKAIFICGCGLSQNLPFCDGSHKPCKTEEPGVIHVYDADRKTIIETRREPGEPIQ
jgi:CDGSH iron-sulfur domain-containing protein 1